jgi:isocitrate dehydrogenase
MYAISVVNVGKYKVLSDALGDAFGGRGAAPGQYPIDRGRSAAEPHRHASAPKRCGASANA